ncbi:MAG: DUF4190 domain-containing protein [Thermoleophilaceae bacterium]|nr:DUF4190 domain-containing protein [Thermoleophilaceae bacterium]
MVGGDEQGDGGQSGYLPPEPGGLEPDLGAGSAAAPVPHPPQPPAQGAWQPPQHAQHAQQPAQGYAQPQPPPQGGWTPPPQGWYPPPAHSQPWGYDPQQPREPDNGAAVAGFTLAVVGGALLLLSAGVSSLVSIVCGALGIFYSLKGRRRVDRGETPKHRSLAQAGFVIGIVTVVLAVLATAFWVLFGTLYATDEEFRKNLEDDSGGSGDGIQTSVRAAGVLGRAAWSLLS